MNESHDPGVVAELREKLSRFVTANDGVAQAVSQLPDAALQDLLVETGLLRIPVRDGVSHLDTRIDTLCDAFVRTWRSGQRPKIEDYLPQVEESASDILIEALVREEVRLRRQSGEDVEADEYFARFPGNSAAIGRALINLSANSPDADRMSSPSRRPDGGASADRFRVIRPHATGGLGEVSVAQDTELNREVALKQIQSKYVHDTQSRSRFLLEAEITAGLEHPGIVPVYGKGEYADGRPYYAMRFIQGDSLKDAIRRFHVQFAETSPETSSPMSSAQSHLPETAYNSLEFRKLLGHLITVCQTIGYAHSRGVLHRDLKPANIMLGKYGETLVVDWGLAKLQSRGAPASPEGEAALIPEAARDLARSIAGSVMGTPSYMSPEQAAGQHEELSPASDIYSLGATLYTMLTGKSPFSGKDADDVLAGVRAGKLAPPRSSQPHVPPVLEAICLKAMNPNAADRYGTTRELTDDLERFLADEPIPSFPEPVSVQAGRWARKHQTLAISSLSVLLISAVGLGVFASVLDGKNATLTSTNRKLKAAIVRERDARDLADQRFALAFEAWETVVTRVDEGLAGLPVTRGVRDKILDDARVEIERLIAAGEESLDKRSLIAAHVKLAKLASADAAKADSHYSIALAQGRSWYEADPTKYEALDGYCTALLGSAIHDCALANAERVQQGKDKLRRVHQLRWDYVASHPGNRSAIRKLLEATKELSELVMGQDVERRREVLTEAEVFCRRLTDNDLTDDEANVVAYVYDELAAMNRMAGDLQAAMQYAQRSVDTTKPLEPSPPDDRWLRNMALGYRNLAKLNHELGDYKSELDNLNQAAYYLENRRELQSPTQQLMSDIAMLHMDRCDPYDQTGDTSGAERALQECLRITEQELNTARDESEVLDWKDTLAIASAKLAGKYQKWKIHADQVEPLWRRSLEVRRELAKIDHDKYRPVVVNSLAGMSRTFMDQRRFAEAEPLITEANSLASQMFAADTTNAAALQKLTLATNLQLQLQRATFDDDAARVTVREWVARQRELLAREQDAVTNVDGLIAALREAAVIEPDFDVRKKYLDEALALVAGLEERRGSVGASLAQRRRGLQSELEFLRSERAILEDWESLRRQQPDDLGRLVHTIVGELASRYSYAEAGQVAKKLVSLDQADASQLYDSACIFAICAVGVRPAKSQSDLSPEQAAQRQQWMTLALDALRKSVAKGFDDFEHMRLDEDLAILRDTPEFKALTSP